MCDGDTKLVVVKAKKVESIPKIAEIEIDTLDLYFVIRRNGTAKRGRLLLLPTQALGSRVNRQASGL